MKTMLRTPEQEQALEELKRRSHSLNSGIPNGVDGQSVVIQAHAMQVLSGPTPWAAAVRITGMATGAVSEVMDRIEGAFAHLRIPEPEVQILIHLVPADLRKHGAGLDLPVAIAVLQAAGILPELPDQGGYFLMGELDTEGNVLRVPDALSVAWSAVRGQTLIVPAANGKECSLILARAGYDESRVCPVNLLSDVIDSFLGKRELSAVLPPQFHDDDVHSSVPDFETIRGQEMAKRAAVISAAGGHNLLLVGPPEVGKTLVAKALPGIMPRLSVEEQIERTRLYSASGHLAKDGAIVTQRPMRAPHHTASKEALVGGGSGVATPGEITLAHRGVLFLDEITEFAPSTLNSLRQPLEAGEVHISRAGGMEKFPARFTLLAAMNPFPCGYNGTDSADKCHCTPSKVREYEQRLNGPIRDRIDLQVTMNRLTFDEQYAPTTTGASPKMREQVEGARAIQTRRFAGHQIPFNAAIPGGRVLEFCKLSEDGMTAFKQIIADSGESARVSDSLAKVARTVADLEGSEHVERRHLEEAARFVLDEKSRDTARPSTPSVDRKPAPSISGATPRDTGRPAAQRTLF